MTPLTRTALEQADDHFLVDRAADGDVRAFTVLAKRYRALLRTYATRILGAAADADDVVQETLVTAWQQLPSLRDRSRARSWLLQITSRNALDVLRRRRPTSDIAEVDAPDTAATPAQQADLRSVQHALTSSLDALPVQQRQAWVLRELGGNSYDEIAAELQLPVSTVRGLLARARTRLTRDLDEWR